MTNRALVCGLAFLCLTACGPQPGPAADDAAEVEAFVRAYYDAIEALDYEAMRAMSTPDFEILDEGMRLGHYEFSTHVNGAKQFDREMRFELSDFRTVVTPQVAYTTYVTTRPLDPIDGLDGMILRRVGDRWLVDRYFHTPMLDGTDPFRVPPSAEQ